MTAEELLVFMDTTPNNDIEFLVLESIDFGLSDENDVNLTKMTDGHIVQKTINKQELVDLLTKNEWLKECFGRKAKFISHLFNEVEF